MFSIVGHRSKGKHLLMVLDLKCKEEFGKLTGYPDIVNNKK